MCQGSHTSRDPLPGAYTVDVVVDGWSGLSTAGFMSQDAKQAAHGQPSHQLGV
jgi:hypothetical protein